MSLEDKIAIVTGSSRGIGKAIALGLARAGASVVVAARSEEERPNAPGTIHATVAEIEALGGQALAVRCNVREEQDIYNVVNQTLEVFGGQAHVTSVTTESVSVGIDGTVTVVDPFTIGHTYKGQGMNAQ
ncbi:MAG: SDR family NAD(P)-dependent oxidoreductase, partial [Dehalococcoidia bacterium]